MKPGGRDTWKLLNDVLTELAATCGGAFAFVVDQGNGLWCVGIPEREPRVFLNQAEKIADGFYRERVAPRLASHCGFAVESVRVDGTDRHIALPFAGIYLTVVWFGDAPVDPFTARQRVRAALPEIEKLVLALPPLGGPGRNASEGKARA